MNQTEFLSFFERFLQLQSWDPLQSEVPALLSTVLESAGAKAERVESNGIVNIVASTGGTPRVVLNGHWDTVLPNESFRRDVQLVHRTDTSIKGLGACDMKSGAAAMLGAFLDAHAAGIEGVILSLVGDEERGGKNGTKVLVERGYTAPWVILGEPTSLAISLGQEGLCRIKLSAEGTAAHAAYPQRGINAITKIVRALAALEDAFPTPATSTDQAQIFRRITASPTTIGGGTAPNVIPDRAEAGIDVRIPPGVSPEEAFSKIRAIVSGTNSVESQNMAWGWELTRGSELHERVLATMRDLGIEPREVLKMGSNDGKYYAPTGASILNVGPGNNQLSHTPEEFVSIEELLTARRLYAKLVVPS